jgi:hypothetical protein
MGLNLQRSRKECLKVGTSLALDFAGLLLACATWAVSGPRFFGSGMSRMPIETTIC